MTLKLFLHGYAKPELTCDKLPNDDPSSQGVLKKSDGLLLVFVVTPHHLKRSQDGDKRQRFLIPSFLVDSPHLFSRLHNKRPAPTF